MRKKKALRYDTNSVRATLNATVCEYFFQHVSVPAHLVKKKEKLSKHICVTRTTLLSQFLRQPNLT